MDNKFKRTYELDLIRFLAAVSVVIYHYKTLIVKSMDNYPDFTASLYSITKFGYLGVDLFFIVSGFVIFSSALNRTPSEFAISRIIRIYPTLWVCATATAAILIIFTGFGSFQPLKYVTNLTLFHSYMGIDSIDGVYWTLVTEIKFYLCMFLLIYFGLFNKYKIWIAIWLCLTILFFVNSQPFFLGWFISPYYSPYFISGIIFYLARKDGYNLFYVITLLTSLVLASIYAYDVIDSFSKNISQLDRVIAVAIVCSFYLIFLLISLEKLTLKASKVFIIMGGMTYPLYLLHNVIGKTIFNYFSNIIHPIPLIFIISIMIFYISYLAYEYIEVRYSKRLKLSLNSLLAHK